MKKLFLVTALLLVTLIFASCGESGERIFDYQEKLRSISGTYKENGTEYKIELYFAKNDEGEMICRRIEYSYPENLAGLTFTLEGKNITAEHCGVRISDTWLDEERVFRASRLFYLSEEDIYEIKSAKNDTTVAKGKNESSRWQVTTSKKGLPVNIRYEGAEGELEFIVERADISGGQSSTEDASEEKGK